MAEVDSGALSSLEHSMESSLEQSMDESSMEHHGDSVMGIVVGTLLTATTLVLLSVLGEWIINHGFSCLLIECLRNLSPYVAGRYRTGQHLETPPLPYLKCLGINALKQIKILQIYHFRNSICHAKICKLLIFCLSPVQVTELRKS